MKKVLFILMALGLASFARAENHTGDLGVGIVLGDVDGPTANYFIGPNTSLDVGLGFSHDMQAYGDIIWHGWDVFPQPTVGKFSGYLGVGPRYEERDHSDDKFGVRGLAGVDYWMNPYPIQFFLEGGPWFVFSPDTDTEFDIGIGVRFYFHSSSSGGRR